jgi:hypothetical protein
MPGFESATLRSRDRPATPALHALRLLRQRAGTVFAEMRGDVLNPDRHAVASCVGAARPGSLIAGNARVVG